MVFSVNFPISTYWPAVGGRFGFASLTKLIDNGGLCRTGLYMYLYFICRELYITWPSPEYM